MIIITIVHVCIITNDKTVHWIFFWNTDNLFVVTNIFKAKPVALYVFRYLYQLLHMHSIKDIYHVYIHLSSGILKLKKGIKLILSLECMLRNWRKRLVVFAGLYFCTNIYLSLAIGKFALEFQSKLILRLQLVVCGCLDFFEKFVITAFTPKWEFLFWIIVYITMSGIN